jgi:hypothetical protein
MGNGPSLNDMDLTLFNDETVLASNAVYLLFPKIQWRPLYYGCADSRVLPDIAPNIVDMLRLHPNMDAFFPRFLRSYDGTNITIETSSLLPDFPNVHFFDQLNMDPANLPDSAFAVGDLSPLCTPNTVTITLLQIAAIMGFTEIFLIGCDTNYTIPGTVIQQGARVQPVSDERLLLTSTADDDPNHFTPDYFGRGRKWHHPKVEQMLAHYLLAKQVLDSAGIAVYNATVGGKLDIFPRIDYRKALATK